MQNQIELKRLFGHFSGAHLPPSSVVQYFEDWYMYLTDNDGYVCLSSRKDGGNTWEEPVRLFADWGWVKGAPSVIDFHGTYCMCVVSGNGTVLIAKSSNGDSWPTAPEAILGDFRSPRSGATLTIIEGVLYVIVLDHNGTPFIGEIPV